MDTTNNVIIFERAGLLFIFNFSPTNSIPDYEFWVPEAGSYQILLNSDRSEFGGFNRVADDIVYPSVARGKDNFLRLYLTNRTALVLKKQA
jgi:1,4-alpha-glucan branching enzyme